MKRRNRFYTNFEIDWDHILLSYYEDGKKKVERIKIKPRLFVPSGLDRADYTTFDGKPVMRVDFDSVREARNFIKSYEGSGNVKIYGSPLFQYVYIYDNFKDQQVDTRLIRILNYDIETDTEDGYPDAQLANREINAVSMKLFGSKDIYVLGLKDYETKEPELLDLIAKGYKIHYRKCSDERELLEAFFFIWKKLDPDVVTGWNISKFDNPYLIKRARYLFSDEFVNSLSPFKKISNGTMTWFNKEIDTVDIVGVKTLDYMEIYKKFSQGVEESYSLNYLSTKILDKQKLDYSDYGNLARLYRENHNKYIDYNIIDIIRVEEIDEAVNYMDIAFEIAYETLTNFNDSLTTIRVWDVMIHNYLMDQNKVVPHFSGDQRKERSIAGGHVKIPHVGKHNWVMSFDFKSLYPHLCMSFNISPDTYLGTFKPVYGEVSVQKIMENQLDAYRDKILSQDVTVTGCGTVFTRKKQGFIPALMERLFAMRAEHQKQEDIYEKKFAASKDPEDGQLFNIFANKSYAIKILLNSGYGAISNEWFRFFNDNIAESFTLSGQLAIKTVEVFVNDALNKYMGTTDVDYICAIDTDSIYINLSSLVDKECADKDPVDFLEEFSSTIQGWIQEGLEHLYTNTNVFKKKLFMSLEAIGPAIWIAKKRYVMSLPSYKKIRFDPPKIKIMGIEAVRSTTPQIVRKWITDAIPMALEGDSTKIKKYIDDKWNEFIELPFDATAMPKGTNDLEKYMDKRMVYGPRTPLHVRGALLFNHYVIKNNWQKEVDVIKSGDKVKTMYLKLPNPLMENVISVPEEIPAQLKDFEEYIDHQKQFDKTFLDAFTRITSAANINLSSNVSMDNFYG